MARIRSIKPELWTSSRVAATTRPVWIYCVTEEGSEDSGPCKIGVATNVESRFSALQGGNWRPLVTVWRVRTPDSSCAIEYEQNCLMRLRPSVYEARPVRRRLMSEWLDATPAEALSVVSTLMNAADHALLRMAVAT